MPPISPRKLAAILGASVLALCGVASARADTVEQMRARLPQQEVIYFALPDRFANGDPANDKGGLTGDRLVTGFDPVTGGEVLVAFNTSDMALTAQVAVAVGSLQFKALAGACPQAASAPGSVALALPAFGYAVCAATRDK